MNRLALLSIVFLSLILIGGCSSEKPTATPTIASTPATPIVLELIGPTETRSLTMDDLKALPAVEGWSGGKSSTGRITVPAPHTGVTLQELAAQVGGLQPGMGLSVVAKDGYAMTYSYDQIVNGAFVTYDPGTGEEITLDDPLQVIVAYARDGQPIPDTEDGPLRMAVISSRNNQVVDGHWLVKWVTAVEVKAMAEDWVLQMDGALSGEIDRASFESCAAANCHQAAWTDADGQTWTGVPLWRLAGWLDDAEKHGDLAYNQELADQGYTLEVIAADGYSASFESARFDRRDDLLVAYLVNGEPLAEKNFPLRLVGTDLQKNEMIGQIAQLKADLQPVQAITATETIAPPPQEWNLSLEGALTESVNWQAFQNCASAKCHQAEWTDADGQVWTGVPLWRLAGRVDDDNAHDDGAFNQALADQGYTLEAIAADGYSAAFDSARIARNDTVLLAYLVNGEWLAEKHFPLRVVGDGLEKNEMIGQVAKIVVQLPMPEAEAPTGNAALAISGAVAQEQALSLEALQGMDVVEITVEHPKKGMQTYTGVRLNALLDLTGPAAEAIKLVFTASDGYQVEAALADVRACADCLVALADDGTLNLVMPDMESSLWIKDLTRIEVQ